MVDVFFYRVICQVFLHKLIEEFNKISMNIKSFILGVVAGAILTFGGLFVFAMLNQSSTTEDAVQYLEKPVSYENKKESSFKVLQVIGNAALAKEKSSDEYDFYNGNTVVILGENYYSDEIITIIDPIRVGTYSYTNKAGMPMTVPVLEGDLAE